MILPHDEQGSGQPVVLLHAGVADRRMFSPLLPLLAAGGLRAIAVDLPGYGDVPLGPEPIAPWSDVAETLDELGLQDVLLAGNSFGALIAKRVALIARERLAALALISAPPEEDEDPSPQLAAIWEAEETALESGEIAAAVEVVLAAWTLPEAPGDQRELVAEMQRRAFELQTQAGEIEYAPDPLEVDPGGLAGLEIPVLVAVGEHDMADFQDAARRIASELPRAALRTIAGAGHLAPLERPAAVAELLSGLAAGEFPT